jgi:tetratricopeptide (TPR) repeat protein
MLEQIEQQIEELNDRARQLHKAEKYDQAIEAAGEAIAMARQHLGESHLSLATSLESLATVHLSDPDYDTAWRLFEEAITVRRRVLGANHPDLAGAINNLARLHEVTGDYQGAGPLYREALEIRRVALGEENPLFAASLNNLAGLLQTTGDYAAAAQYYIQAIAILRKSAGEKHLTVASGLNNLGSLYSHLGDYAAAEPLYKEALDIRREVQGEDHPEFARTLNNLAHLYEALGNYAAAEPLYMQSLEIRRNTVGEKDPAFARVLSNLAGLYETMGEYARAAPLYRQVIEIDRLAYGVHHQTYATDLNNLAALHQATAHYAEAEALYKQAIEIDRQALGEDHTNYAMDLSNLAALYEAVGNYEAAIPLAERALEVFRSKLGEKHHYVSAVLDNLALLHQRMGRHDLSQELLQQALDIQQSTIGPDHPLIAKTLNSLGFVAYEIGDYDSAERYYRRALRMQYRTLGRQHPNVSASLGNLATVYVAMGRLPRSLALMRRANAIDDLVIEQVLGIGSESQRMDYLASLRRDLHIFLSLITYYVDSPPRACQLGMELVLRRKGLGAEALAAQRDAVLGGLYPTLTASVGKLINLRMQIARRALSGPGEEGLEEHEHLLAEWNREKDLLESDLSTQIPEIRLRRHFQEVSVSSVANAIPVGATLVEFVRYSSFDFKAVPGKGDTSWKASRYLAFVLESGRHEQVQIVDLGEAEPIDRLIDEYRALITHTAPPQAPFEMSAFRSVRDAEVIPESGSAMQRRRIGTELRELVFDPLLRTNCLRSSLLLAPDGDLTRLPFEVLPLEDGSHLIDAYRVSYLSAGRDVLHLKVEASGQYSEPVVAAAPDFDLNYAEAANLFAEPSEEQPVDGATSSSDFPRLTGTVAEGLQIGALLGVQPLLGPAVLESTLKHLRSPRILHIATHGFFLPGYQADFGDEGRHPSEDPGHPFARLLQLSRLENPLLRSGLVLAGINKWLRWESLPTEAEDGILTAEDVTGLDLYATELVVLSACDTGLGQIEVGEGVYGLRRAFMLAGARTLVMTLWKVPDQQTQELMAEFYHHILDGQPRAAGLREAQLAIKARHPDPLYWGAFICQGDPGPLRRINHVPN